MSLVILSHILKPRLRPGSCQDGSLEQEAKYVESTDAATPLRSAFSWGIAFAVSDAPAGQPVAAGDQQISDVAVMPLMKLTQRSLPHCGPPRGRKHSYSPRQAFVFQPSVFLI